MDMSALKSPWAAGFAMAAAALMIIAGALSVIEGIVALFKDEFFVITQKWVFSFDLTVWGWIHLILGVVMIAAALLILAGNLLGRIIGIIVAAVSAIANFAWLPYYPVWSIVVIAFCAAVIWALAVHGKEMGAD